MPSDYLQQMETIYSNGNNANFSDEHKADSEEHCAISATLTHAQLSSPAIILLTAAQMSLSPTGIP